MSTLTMADNMQINTQRAKQLTEKLTSITSRIKAANKSNKNVCKTPQSLTSHAH